MCAQRPVRVPSRRRRHHEHRGRLVAWPANWREHLCKTDFVLSSAVVLICTELPIRCGRVVANPGDALAVGIAARARVVAEPERASFKLYTVTCIQMQKRLDGDMSTV